MLRQINKINDIYNTLENHPDVLEKEFRIFLKLETEIEVFVKTNNPKSFTNLFQDENVFVYPISPDDIKEDDYYRSIFSNKQKTDLGRMWRFHALLNNSQQEHKNPCNVVTFYSYKGGMGRTTTLCAYALHLAQKGKKVVILDCDFEAPGFLSFFNLDKQQEQTQKNGIVEYLLDKEFVGSQHINLANDYILEVDKDYCGEKGKIFVLPSGNLSYTSIFDNPEIEIPNTHLDHYLHGLARLNISNSDKMIRQFRELFNDLAKNLELTEDDYILIDSRTGFNEIFGITALNLSNVIVGFFGSSEQTRAGLYFLLDKYIDIKLQNQEEIKQPKLLLVNSIVPKDEVIAKIFNKSLDNLITNYADKTSKKIEQIYENETPFTDIPRVSLGENKILKEIGVKFYETDEENEKKGKELITLVKTKEFVDYDNETKTFEDLEKIFTEINEFTNNINENFDIDTLSIRDLRKNILGYLNDLLKQNENGVVKLFAEDGDINAKYFFYRDCMKPLFTKEKFIIQGFKGTGKTYLYKALTNKDTQEIILKKSGINNTNIYKFVDVVEVKNAESNYKNMPFKDEIDEIKNFNDFWQIYMWSSIMLDNSIETEIKKFREKFPNEKLEKTILELKNAEIKKRRLIFSEYIKNDINSVVIEQDLKNLNSFLKEEETQLFILFDQLDKIAETKDWGKIITPLVEFWRDNYNKSMYSNIYPKIFIRTDIVSRISTNNVESIKKTNVIPIEWKNTEIYLYFFNLLFSNDNIKEMFFKVMFLYKEYSSEIIEALKIKDKNLNILTENEIKILLNTFFGHEIKTHSGHNLGDPFKFFYLNFSNADETISLRPFINIMSGAINNGLENQLPKRIYIGENSEFDDNNDYEYYPEYKENPPVKPILHYVYVTDPDVRETATKEHFNDLTSEVGNQVLNPIIEYIQKLHRNSPLKKVRLTEIEMDTLLHEVIKTKDLPDTKVNDLKNLLKINGIVYYDERLKIFRFAQLYKYWLGLKSPKDKNQNIFSQNQEIKGLKIVGKIEKNNIVVFNQKLVKGQEIISKIKKVNPDGSGFVYTNHNEHPDLFFYKVEGKIFEEGQEVRYIIGGNKKGFYATNLEKMN